MHKILLVIKEPYLDKIPSLMSLLRYFSLQGAGVTIVSVVADEYPVPAFDDCPNVTFLGIGQKRKKFSMPTSLRLLLGVGRHIATGSLGKERYDCIIGSGSHGNLAAFLVAKMTGSLYVNYCIEYPAFRNIGSEPYTAIDSLYNNVALKQADYIVTFDDTHVDLIAENIGIDRSRFLKLPNAKLGGVFKGDSDMIRTTFGIPREKTVILHSGGLGVWFGSSEIAQAAKEWGDDRVLVFHTSHNAARDTYCKAMQANDYGGRVVFSTTPVPSGKLDEFVASADIGLAWYDRDVLGYRGENMGQAAGKIGDYLKCGLPVITNNFHSLSSYIETYGCGICVDTIAGIGDAVKGILADYGRYRENAFRCYEELWKPDSYLDTIYHKVLGNG